MKIQVLVSVMACLLVVLASCASAKDNHADLARKLLQNAGAVTFAEKAKFAPGVEHGYIGYNAEGKPVAGVALRETATYKKSMAVVAISLPANGQARIDAAVIPDIEDFHGKSKDLTKAALTDITGRVLPSAAEAKGLVNAVTGATKYYQAIYVSYSVMASALMDVMNQNPAWDKKPLE